jgi:flagellar basal-body rod modification protein FlgD
MNHQMTAGQALTGNSANPLAAATAGTSGTSSTSSTGSSSATISANDFLTLLVTEMQNQDPTAQTDPNEYINQLVQVNSLEQLIDINQNLAAVLGAATTPSGSSSTSGPVSSSQTPSGLAARSASGLAARGPHVNAHGGAAAHKPGGVAAAHSGGSTTGGSGTAAAISKFAQSAGAKGAPGNLSIPKAQPAAHRVAHALDGHSHAQAIPGRLPGA